MRTAVLELLLSLVEAPQLPSQSKGHPDGKVRAIAVRIREHPERDYPIEKLSSEAALSTVAFSEAFKRETGLPPHAFLVNCRLERARHDLEDDRGSVADVSSRYGFSSPRHLATAFKRMFGVSPRDVQKNNF